jgi:hypothetical protein
MSTVYYTNTINYTEQAAGMAYTSFQTPLEGNKILLFLTAISIFATGQVGSTYYPVNLNIKATVLTKNTYNLSASLSVNVIVKQLQFSMVVLN